MRWKCENIKSSQFPRTIGVTAIKKIYPLPTDTSLVTDDVGQRTRVGEEEEEEEAARTLLNLVQ